MSRKGTPIDYSPMESWHEILKKENLHNVEVKKTQEIILSLFFICELFGVHFILSLFYSAYLLIKFIIIADASALVALLFGFKYLLPSFSAPLIILLAAAHFKAGSA